MGTLATQTMSFNAEWTCAELSHAVCDALVAAEKLRVKPAFIRADREVKITGVFESAGLDGTKMTTCNTRGVEVQSGTQPKAKPGWTMCKAHSVTCFRKMLRTRQKVLVNLRS